MVMKKFKWTLMRTINMPTNNKREVNRVPPPVENEGGDCKHEKRGPVTDLAPDQII